MFGFCYWIEGTLAKYHGSIQVGHNLMVFMDALPYSVRLSKPFEPWSAVKTTCNLWSAVHAGSGTLPVSVCVVVISIQTNVATLLAAKYFLFVLIVFGEWEPPPPQLYDHHHDHLWNLISFNINLWRKINSVKIKTHKITFCEIKNLRTII